MSHPRFSRWYGLIGSIMIGLFILGGLQVIKETPTHAAPIACGSGESGPISEDTTWSGNVYIDGHIKVNDSSTLTITAGSQVIFCDTYYLQIGTPFTSGRLVAKGTTGQPIHFTTANEQTRWEHLIFESHLDAGPSILQHAYLEHGGGTDPSGGQTIKIVDRAANPNYATPLIDHVIVHDSNGYGIDVEASGTDPNPAQLTNVTIENSALAPVNVAPNAVTGIGAGFTAIGNSPDHIRVAGTDNMNFDSRWRDHGIPYEVVDGFAIVSNYPDSELVPAVWTIDPGVTILMHPGVSVDIGTLTGEGKVLAQGTADAPITFSRLDQNSAPWGGFDFSAYNDLNSEFGHVIIEQGGDLTGNREAVFVKQGHSSLALDNISITFSQNGAIWVFGGDVWVKDSTLSNNRYGIDVRNGSNARINGSDLSNNIEFALNNSSPNSVCVDAVGNYWGAGGPQDSSAEEDACHSTRTNDGAGVVGNGVSYTPWQTAPEGGGAYGAITPASFWVLGNSADSTELTVTLLDEAGDPLAGKQVELETTVGTLQQPTTPTDVQGQTTAVISSTEIGFAIITAFNLTDNTPVAGTAGVNFWQGSGDYGGLIDPGGTPYASPKFEVRGKPFQEGFPVEMRMPMQNSRSTTVNVEVIYAVTNLSIGARFTPVYTTTKTLQPGEAWEAQGVWVPNATGHHCIQAQLSYDDGAQQHAILESGGGNDQINTDENPCSGLANGPGDFTPNRPQGGSEDLKTAAKHFKNQATNLYDANNCIAEEASFRRFAPRDLDEQRDYEIIVTPPEYTPPPVEPGEHLTPAQAEALTTMSQTSADLLGLGRAIAVTRQRIQGAAQANSLSDLDRQYEAFLDFLAQYIQTLRTLADQHDDFLAVTEGAGVPDAYYYPEDYEAAFADLKQNGFSSSVHTFLQQSGVSDELIEELQNDVIEETEGRLFQTTSFYQVVRNTRDNALSLADQLEHQYGLAVSLNAETSQLSGATEITAVDQEFSFVVGYQRAGEETVDLVIRSMSMPMDWSARLEQDAVTVGAGETVSNTLTLVPGNTIPEGSTVKLGVEGYIDGEYIGGILFTYNAPLVSRRRNSGTIYLPTVIR